MSEHILAHALARSPGLDQHYTLSGGGLTCKHCTRYTTHQVSNARLHLAARHEAAYDQLLEVEKHAEANQLALAEKQQADAHLPIPAKRATTKRTPSPKGAN